MKLPKLFLFAVALVLASCQSPTIAPLADHALLPYPNAVSSGESALNINTIQNLSIDADFSDLGQQIAQEWEMHTTNSLEVTEAGKAQLHFSLDDQVDGPEEAYSLEIDKKKIVIKAKAEVGLFRAWQTLKQLITLRQLTPEKDYLPTGVIQDDLAQTDQCWRKYRSGWRRRRFLYTRTIQRIGRLCSKAIYYPCT